MRSPTYVHVHTCTKGCIILHALHAGTLHNLLIALRNVRLSNLCANLQIVLCKLVMMTWSWHFAAVYMCIRQSRRHNRRHDYMDRILHCNASESIICNTYVRSRSQRLQSGKKRSSNKILLAAACEDIARQCAAPSCQHTADDSGLAVLRSQCSGH